MAHDVARRRAELALRMAVGAGPRRVLRETLQRGGRMIAAGLAMGGLLSIWAARALDDLGVTAAGLDALSIGLPAVLLIMASLAAVLPAARRAARIDPLTALRGE